MSKKKYHMAWEFGVPGFHIYSDRIHLDRFCNIQGKSVKTYSGQCTYMTRGVCYTAHK